MVRSLHSFIHITDDITKKQMDIVIQKLNDRLNKENSNWFIRYDGHSVDTKYWVSYEIKPSGQEQQDKFFSFRISSFQYKNKYVEIHNKYNQLEELPDDSYILTKNEKYYNRKRDGLNLYLYSKNVNTDEIKYLLDIFNNELNKVGASIIMKLRESDKLVDFNDAP